MENGATSETWLRKSGCYAPQIELVLPEHQPRILGTGEKYLAPLECSPGSALEESRCS